MGESNLFAGLPDDPTNIPNSFLFMKKSCIPYTDTATGKQYFVKLVASETQKENRAAVREAVRAFTKLYNDRTFLAAPDGVYTWIVSDAGFLAARVLSLFELGTLHKQLATFLGATKVFVAGESEKKEDAIEINLQSGTFTLKILEKHEKNTTVPTRLRTSAKKVFEGMGFVKVTELPEKTLLRDEKTPVSREELSLYQVAGFDVELWLTKDDCFGWDISAVQGEINHTLGVIKDKQRDVTLKKDMEREGKTTGRLYTWIKNAPTQLEAAEKELDALKLKLEEVKREREQKRIPFVATRKRKRNSDNNLTK